MYLKFFVNSFGYRAAAMSGRQEPISKYRHDPALDRYKKARQDMHPRLSEQTSRRSARAAASTAPQYREGDNSSSSDIDT